MPAWHDLYCLNKQRNVSALRRIEHFSLPDNCARLALNTTRKRYGALCTSQSKKSGWFYDNLYSSRPVMLSVGRSDNANGTKTSDFDSD